MIRACCSSIQRTVPFPRNGVCFLALHGLRHRPLPEHGIGAQQGAMDSARLTGRVALVAQGGFFATGRVPPCEPHSV